MAALVGVSEKSFLESVERGTCFLFTWTLAEGIDKSNQQIVQDWVRSRERERRNALAAELAAARSEADLVFNNIYISIFYTLT